MKRFDLYVTGDMATPSGKPVGDLGLDAFSSSPWVTQRFLPDQVPKLEDTSYQDRQYTMEVTAEAVARADGIVICRPWLKAAALAQGAEKLVAVGRSGIGYDKLDLDACTAADVVVYNAPHALTHPTASAALLLILACSKRLPAQERILREGRWDQQETAVGDDLQGMTLGLIGFGRTATELVRLIAPFQMRIIAFSPRADPAEAAKAGVILLDNIEDIFRQSDYVSLHNRLTAETRKSIGESLLQMMKPTAFFINIARGEIVEEEALVRALENRRIAGAGLDVFAHEPLRLSSPLLKLDNVLLTPHWLCSTRQSGRATWAAVMEGMRRVAQGEIPANVLNPAVLERPGFRSKLKTFEVNR
jgi:phosphoglycerate dehydrogenase-like enzyme